MKKENEQKPKHRYYDASGRVQKPTPEEKGRNSLKKVKNLEESAESKKKNPEENAREYEYDDKNNINTRIGGIPIMSTLLKIAFIIAIIAEAWLFYEWVIEPLMPIIQQFIATKGTVSFDFNMPSITEGVSFPMNTFSIGGSSPSSLMSLVLNTLIRVAVFSLLFTVTIKVHSLLQKAVR